AATAVLDHWNATRVARLLGSGEEPTTTPETTAAGDVFRGMPSEEREVTEAFLGRVPVHGWHRAWRGHRDYATGAKQQALATIVANWTARNGDHVVLSQGVVLPCDSGASWRPVFRETSLLNGTTALVVG